MKGYGLALIVCALSASVALAEDAKRPRITGVAHMALYVHDVDKSLAFYKDFLGFDEPFRLNKPDGGLSLTFIKISDRQYIELFPEREAGTDRLNHIALETVDAEAMRAYLAARGVKVPDKVPVGRIGNANFNITDPDGHTVEIVQYLPESWTLREQGKYMTDARVSTRIMHVGIIVGSLEPALAFYRDILGFQEIWRGSADGKQLNWVNLKVPEGDDYLEFMLYKNPPTLTRLGTMHHLSLDVPDISASKATLEGRKERTGYTRDLEFKTGVNRKRQLNLFDPDGTRVELMEPKTVDGAPTPSSTAPPP
jgi:catechol 2,3-dioxygenase-like lactoylglutathione lyase family enzyme